MNKNTIKTLFLLLVTSITNAQEITPFKEQFKTNIKGDFILVSNNIVNRSASFQNPNSPSNETGPSAQLNDEYEMKYIDIDNDSSTFSSSSAALAIPTANSKIVYAALYWSATYNSEASTQKSVNKYKITDKNRSKSLNEIKFKTPSSTSYQTVSGKIIYDGNKKDAPFFNSSPYAAFADVTAIVAAQNDPNGNYTVANVAATQGTIEGGVAAGWTLFVVYENDALSAKFISSYDGFAAANDEPITIDYSGFTAAQSGIIKAKIGLVALEGDHNLVGDSFLVKASQNKNFTKLETNSRKANGFFNSSITNENEMVMTREPNSKNTLGYDACTLTVPNEDNAVFNAETNGASLRLQASGDRYFMFFNVFSIESIPFETPKNTEIVAAVVAESTSVEPPVVKEVKKSKSKSKGKVSKAKESLPELVEKPIQKIEKIEKIENPIAEKPQAKTNIPNALTTISYEKMEGVQKGYYIVANVFSKPKNATNFKAKLIADQIGSPQIFRNPLNNFDYVYIEKFDTEQDALTAFQAFKNGIYSDPLWIKAINVQ
jgi:hypothetical protein